MYRLVSAIAAVVCLPSLGFNLVAAQSERAPEELIAFRVVEVRFNYMDPETKFNSCHLFEQTGRPSDFPEGFRLLATLALDRQEDFCGESRIEFPVASLRSIQIHGDTATVEVRVSRDHYEHQETYTLIPSKYDESWVLLEVRTWGLLRVHRE
jgi:hypothetical protein